MDWPVDKPQFRTREACEDGREMGPQERGDRSLQPLLFTLRRRLCRSLQHPRRHDHRRQLPVPPPAEVRPAHAHRQGHHPIQNRSHVLPRAQAATAPRRHRQLRSSSSAIWAASSTALSSQTTRGSQQAHHQGHGGLRYSALLLFFQPASQSQRQRQGVRRPRADHPSTRLRVLVSARSLYDRLRVFHNRCVRTLPSHNATSTSTRIRQETLNAHVGLQSLDYSTRLLRWPWQQLGCERHKTATHGATAHTLNLN
jgi:hypothetical protein